MNDNALAAFGRALGVLISLPLWPVVHLWNECVMDRSTWNVHCSSVPPILAIVCAAVGCGILVLWFLLRDGAQVVKHGSTGLTVNPAENLKYGIGVGVAVYYAIPLIYDGVLTDPRTWTAPAADNPISATVSAVYYLFYGLAWPVIRTWQSPSLWCTHGGWCWPTAGMAAAFQVGVLVMAAGTFWQFRWDAWRGCLFWLVVYAAMPFIYRGILPQLIYLIRPGVNAVL